MTEINQKPAQPMWDEPCETCGCDLCGCPQPGDVQEDDD